MANPNNDSVNLASLREVAFKLADVARQITLPLFRSPALTADNKLAQGFDPVTQADRDAEAAMRRMLQELRPDDGIIGEEYGVQAGTSGLDWVLDPIDGTRAFLCGAPSWGTLIAVQDRTGPIYGLVDQPFTNERFDGGLGLSASLLDAQGSRDLTTRSTSKLSDAILLTTFPEIGTPEEAAAFARVAETTRLVRYGLDCYAYALLAAGQIDLVVEAGLETYDISAPIALIQAAGGIVTDWQGGPAHQGGQVLAAANEQIHAEALARLIR